MSYYATLKKLTPEMYYDDECFSSYYEDDFSDPYGIGHDGNMDIEPNETGYYVFHLANYSEADEFHAMMDELYRPDPEEYYK